MRKFLFIVTTLFALLSCELNYEENVDFMADPYRFVKNFYVGETNPSYLIINNYSSFDSLFRVGAVMYMDTSKLITEEKMKDGFVLSIIYQGNDIHEFEIQKITLVGTQLLVYYTSEIVDSNASWYCNCSVITLIENCDYNSILLFENGNLLQDVLIKEL
jgi:hypothetical protein